jgi:hypothetical protein
MIILLNRTIKIMVKLIVYYLHWFQFNSVIKRNGKKVAVTAMIVFFNILFIRMIYWLWYLYIYISLDYVLYEDVHFLNAKAASLRVCLSF